MKKTLYDAVVEQEVLDRIKNLTPETQGQWGKMNVAQMMAHCSMPFEVSLGEKELKAPFLMKLMRGFFKPLIFGEKPFKKNSPTLSQFKITDNRIFNNEKERLVKTVKQFAASKGDLPKHPFWGNLTKEESGWGMYKHLDYHLNQFGV